MRADKALANICPTALSPTCALANQNGSGQSIHMNQLQAMLLAVAMNAAFLSTTLLAQPVQFIPQPYSESAYILDSEGMLLVWGHNDYGQLGASNTVNASTPQRLLLPDGVSSWSVAAGGTGCTLAVDQAGRLFTCGNNMFRQLGLMISGTQSNLQLVAFPSGVSRWLDVAGGNGTLLIGDTGAAYAAGDSAAILSNAPQPYVGGLVQIPLPTTASKVMSGRSFYVVLGTDGKLYLWGYNDAAEIGQGYYSGASITNPTALPFPPGVTSWLRAVPGGFHTLAVGSDHQLYGWGANNFGQLGIGTNTVIVTSPIQVPLPAGVNEWLQLAAGEYHSAALGDNGQIYVCGLNTSGILGTESSTNEYRFTQVLRPAGVTIWLAVGAGRYHTLALGDNGRVYAWGYGAYGAMGNGSFANFQPQPGPVKYRLSATATGSAEFQLSADVPSGSNWVIEASSDFQSWSSVSTNVVHQALFQTTRSSAVPFEFWRLTRLP
jgi:alpha-tubulin suppressor-like RCC1 family protein